MYVWPDGSITGSVNAEVLEQLEKAKSAKAKAEIVPPAAPLQNLDEQVPETAPEPEPTPELEPEHKGHTTRRGK